MLRHTQDPNLMPLLKTSPDLHETFHLPLSMQSRDELRNIQAEVAMITPVPADDTWQCVWGDNNFHTSSYYKFYFREVVAHEAFDWLWKAKCIPKIKVFGWFLLADRLNTRNMVKRRHYNIGDDFNFLLCGQQIEQDVEHMIFQCYLYKH